MAEEKIEPLKEAKSSEAQSEGGRKPSSAKAAEGKVEVPDKFKKIVEEIEKMSIMDLAELVKILEDKFGVSPMAAVAAAPAAGAGPEPVKEEKTIFNVELKNAGSQKIQVIKVVRDLTGIGLKEAKDLVEGAPKTVKENVKKEEAEEMKKKLEEAGATVELK